MKASAQAAQTFSASGALKERWREAWLVRRDRLLASPRFQRWAAAFPPTRRIARQNARDLFDLCAGFVYSQVLLACVQLKVFDVLAAGAVSVGAVASRIGLPVDATERLLDAASTLKLVERREEGRYGLGVLGAALRNNRAVLAMIEHHTLLYRDLADPVALLRGEGAPTALSRLWPYAQHTDPAGLEAAEVAAYTTLMSESQSLVAEEILDAYPVHDHRRVLDVGGGEGTFLLAAAARVPHLEVHLFDLPAVAERARGRFAHAGLGTRAQVTGGSFHSNDIPRGADLVTLIRVLHDHDRAAVVTLLRNVRRAMPADGVLLIAEPLSGTPGAEPVGAAYFAFYFLAMGQGRARTFDELALILQEAGFSAPQQYHTRQPLQTSVLIAKPV